ncbi:MAG: acyl-phosphate glycerol 3-phosphate acyltransferase [Sulfobacillus benefaciens]|uniref:Glycerol-3-phosphate acyltransferase n=1 Tax=Sulfobacillus benefaciens TaxID=453960 RepID=A0A2T2XEK7_9FIRM|nr:MAG: acyl-phosphate glycerol 3-phosphate acyltransferase [Sulfobacillus benefaciens]
MLILWGLGAFIVGSVPWGFIVSHLRYQTDIRQHGSQNIGATNVARTLGIKAGIIVLILDALKGIAAVAITGLVFPGHPWMMAVAGFLAILGHVFSPFLRFRGGKGIAAGLGAVVMLSPLAALVAVLAFALTVGITRIVSLASLAGIVGVMVCMALVSPEAYVWGFAVPAVLLTIWAHRKNWSRLIKGEEPRFGKS